jgi:hypothetical protein
VTFLFFLMDIKRLLKSNKVDDFYELFSFALLKPAKIGENVAFYNRNITQMTFAVFLFGHFSPAIC